MAKELASLSDISDPMREMHQGPEPPRICSRCKKPQNPGEYNVTGMGVIYCDDCLALGDLDEHRAHDGTTSI